MSSKEVRHDCKVAGVLTGARDVVVDGSERLLCRSLPIRDMSYGKFLGSNRFFANFKSIRTKNVSRRLRAAIAVVAVRQPQRGTQIVSRVDTSVYHADVARAATKRSISENVPIYGQSDERGMKWRVVIS